MPDLLKDEPAIVMGSDSGIGQATAEAFAAEGADVPVAYFHDGEGAEATKKRVEACGRRAIAVRLDHRNPRDVERLLVHDRGRARDERRPGSVT